MKGGEVRGGTQRNNYHFWITKTALKLRYFWFY